MVVYSYYTEVTKNHATCFCPTLWARGQSTFDGFQYQEQHTPWPVFSFTQSEQIRSIVAIKSSQNILVTRQVLLEHVDLMRCHFRSDDYDGTLVWFSMPETAHKDHCAFYTIVFDLHSPINHSYHSLSRSEDLRHHKEPTRPVK